MIMGIHISVHYSMEAYHSVYEPFLDPTSSKPKVPQHPFTSCSSGLALIIANLTSTAILR